MYGDRWTEAGRALAGVARIAAQYDNNGVDIYFLNSNAQGLSMKVGCFERSISVIEYFPTAISPTSRLQSSFSQSSLTVPRQPDIG